MATQTPFYIVSIERLSEIVATTPRVALADHPTVRDMAARFGMKPEAVARDVAHICMSRDCAKPGRPGRYLDLSASLLEPEPEPTPTRPRG